MHAWFAAFADTRYAVAAPVIGVQVIENYEFLYALIKIFEVINKLSCYIFVGISLGNRQ